jgi:hypothetical protein
LRDLQAADAGSGDDADAEGVLLGHVQAGIVHGHLGRGDAVVAEGILMAGFLLEMKSSTLKPLTWPANLVSKAVVSK